MKKSIEVLNSLFCESLKRGHIKWVEVHLSREHGNIKIEVADELEDQGNFRDELSMVLTKLKWENYIQSYQLVDVENKTLLSLKF